MMKYLYLIAAMILVSGCTDTDQSSHTPLLGTTWNLAELNNRKINHPGPQIPQLRFEAEKVTGNDGCNQQDDFSDNSLPHKRQQAGTVRKG
jgi:heat shock protein HslJ